MESKVPKIDSVTSDLNGIDIIDIGELTWSDRLRPKPKIQGKYLRGDLLGQGTFAKVYEVLDIMTLQRRAVKVFDMQKIDRKFNREEMVKMINQEIALLASCHHPNIIKMVDVHRSHPLHKEPFKKEKSPEPEVQKSSESESQKSEVPIIKQAKDKDQQPTEHKSKHRSKKNKIWMYLEYCMASVSEIMNLSSCNCVSLPPHQARHYFIDLLKGLDYLHSRGIYHKDIKPDNMLINVFNTIKITDLSVSHVVGVFNQTDVCFNTYGTISYQSPEVIFSSDKGFSASALDIWSAGVTLYVMINCKLPFSTVNGLIAMTDSIQKDEPEQTQIMIENPCMSSLINSMLIKDPTKRIKLPQILNHPWLHVDLHELHYPLPSQQNIVTVSETSADEFNVKRKIPIIRANRSPNRQQLTKINHQHLSVIASLRVYQEKVID